MLNLRIRSVLKVLTLVLSSTVVQFASPLAFAQEASSSVEQLTKDFAIACEMSKLSINLGKTDAFKNDKADLAYRVTELMSGAFKTHEVREAYKAITTAADDERVKLWYRAAKNLGVKNFKCKTIGFR